MLKTTAAYKEAIKKNRIIHHQAVINFQDGKNITVEDLDMYTFKILDATSNTNSFDLGSTIARQLTLKLNNIGGRFDDHDFNEAEITAKAGLELLDGTIEWLDKGIYVAEPGEESGNTITVDAFDYMTKFDQPYSNSKLVYPATLGEIVRDACSCCGVHLASDTATFDNDSFIVQRRPEDTSATFRNVLKWVGEIACKFFEIDPFGKLSARWYNTELLESTWIQKKSDIWLDADGNPITDMTGQEIETVLKSVVKKGNSNVVDIDEREEILKISTLLSGSTVQTDDVVITGIRVNEEADENDAVYQFGTEGYQLEISGNKLIQDGNGATIAAYLGERLNGIQFRPLTINTAPDPAREAGDLGLVIDAKGRYHKTIFTNVDYTAHAAQNLVSGAEAPTRLSSVRYSQATIAYKELRANMKKQKAEWNATFDDLQDVMKTKNGLFPIRETMEDGSSILYFCDKPELSDASIVVKFSAAGWAMSTDGGKTWNSGWLVDGSMIASILNAIGINAKWINAGDITVKDADGNIIFHVDMDTGSVNISGNAITIGGKTAAEALSDNLEESKNYSDEIATKVKNMTLLLSNDLQTIAADSEGNIPNFPNVTTTATVLYGATDITNDCSFSITESSGVTGNWDAASHVYTVTGLLVDNGWVDIKATYLGELSITKRFTLSKQKTGQSGRTYYIESSSSILKRGANKIISPNILEFRAYYRDGNEAERHPYSGRFVIEETADGETWTTMYTSSSDENTVRHYLYTILTDDMGQSITDSNGITLGIPRDTTNIRCRLYQSGGTENQIDMQNVIVVVDVDALTQTEIVRLLTNDGEWKGLFYKNGHLYISFDAAMGGELTLGGKNNGNGILIIRDADGNQVGYIDNTGVNFKKGKFSGSLESASGTFTGTLSANNGKIGGWTIDKDKKRIYSDDGSIILDAQNNTISINGVVIKAYGNGVGVRGGFNIICGTEDFSDGTDRFQVFNLNTLSGGNYLRIHNNEVYMSSSSSERYKNIGTEISKDFIEDLYNITPKMAKYKEGYLSSNDERNGVEFPMFIAEDVEKYFPLATDHVDGKVEDWNERIMIPAMFAMLKQQKSEIDTLKQEIQEIKQLIGKE